MPDLHTSSDLCPKVYMAGPDVFRPDARQWFRHLKAEAQALGLRPLIPSDNALAHESAATPSEIALSIYQANVAMLAEADVVVANLEAFRGTEPDSGTVFEVGFAKALGIPVIAYNVPGISYLDQVCLKCGPCERAGDDVFDDRGMLVENFGHSLNLMLACSTRVVSNVEAALVAAKLASADTPRSSSRVKRLP